MSDETTQYDVFLSYHWRDNESVEIVARALRERGLKVFLDRWYLVPGQRWQTALEGVLLSCRTVAVFLGPHGLGSWQQREKELALDRQTREQGFPVIPVLLPGAEPGLEFLSLNTWVDFRIRVDEPEALDILAGAVRGEAPGAALAEQTQAARATLCPFRGLSPFREEDAPFFFGREAYSGRLVEELSRRALVGVVGASGSGKSSVVRAGLLPRLRQDPGGRVWEIATIVPGDRPLRSLSAALLPLFEPKSTAAEADEIERLKRVDSLTEYLAEKEDGLRDVAERILERQPGTDRLLLVVDQWEELYTLAQDDAAQRFVRGLLRTIKTAPISVVLTLRGDFYGRALAQRSLADQLQDAVVNLGPMTREELRRVVVEPAQKVGLTYQPGLENRILDDVGDEPGNLPLLEFVLKGLWEDRHGGEMHHGAYDAMEGVQGAMAKRAEAIWSSLREQDAENEEKLRRVFLHLVHSEEGARDTRRRVELEKLSEEARNVVAELTGERLLVTGRDEATGKETLEVAHEALIRHWGRLRKWLDEDRDFRTWRDRLAVAREDWDRAERKDAGTLLRGGPLAEAERWLGDRGQDLSPGEREFIEQSRAFREEEVRERERQQTEKRRLEEKALREREAGKRRLVVAIASVLVVVALGIAGWQYPVVKAERARRSPVLPEMVVVDPGRFIMGSEDRTDEMPPHEVTIRKRFAIGKYEVTFTEYDKFAYDTERWFPNDQGWGRKRRPVIYVSWEDAMAYAQWLSEKTGRRYRLPTEAEWEYAARSGGKGEKWAGTSEEAKLGDYAWYRNNSDRMTRPVGTKRPNGLGLHDMSGNVWEWVLDCWHDSYGGAPADGSAWESDSDDCGVRVLRGGSCYNEPKSLRSANRSRIHAGFRDGSRGFRLAQDVE